MSHSWADLSLRGKFLYLVSHITIEPILTCYILPNVVASLATMNLNLDKACRVNLRGDNFTDEVCDMIRDRNITPEIDLLEKEVQKVVVEMTYWQPFIKNIFPIVLILFLGSFSDRTGRRKPFLLLPIAGELLTTIGLILCVLEREWPMEVAGVIEAIFPAITGGMTTMLMACFSYIGDISTVANRTVRMGVVNIFVQTAVPLGLLSSGFLYQAVGFIGVFSITATLYILGLIYGSIRVKEIRKPVKLKGSFFKELLNPKHVVETFNVAFKSRKGNLRLRIILLMFLSVLIYGPIHGEGAVGYLFVRTRFGWNEVDFSIYSTYGIIVNLIGTSIAMGLLSHKLKMEDSMLGMVACVTKIIAAVCYAFCTTATQFYIVSLIDMIGGASAIALRSIASKLVPSEELGKINSLFGICDAVVPLIYQPMYGFVYRNTVDTLPGAFFLVGSTLTLPSVFIFLYLYYLQKKDPLNTETSQGTNEITNAAFDMSEENGEVPPINTKL